MGRKRCAACGDGFTPCRHVPNQQYCSKPACQRERRRRWQRAKLKQDPDYRSNQAAAQRRWRECHPHYWRTASAIPSTPRATVNNSAKGTGAEAQPVRVHCQGRLQKWTCTTTRIP